MSSRYLLQYARTPIRETIRSYAFKSNLKIKWVRPEKIPCYKPEKSGDLSKLPVASSKEWLVEFRNSKELQSAEPAVQSLFQLCNNPNIHTSNYHREQMIKEVQRHPLDYGSMEAKLAEMTATIRRFQERMETHPRDKRIKVQLKELIDKRKKFLKYLRRWDYRRFEWILEKLDLVYKPPPPKFHWITRKESLQKLTDLHCQQIEEDRLNEYQQILERQQIEFLENAIKKMEFVHKEQTDLKITQTVTPELINEMRAELEKLKQNATAAQEPQNAIEN